MRATMSEGPPAVKPTMMREGLDGNDCCALAPPAASVASKQMMGFMSSSCRFSGMRCGRSYACGGEHHVRAFLPDRDRRDIRVGRRDRGTDRRVDDAQTGDAAHAQLRID